MASILQSLAADNLLEIYLAFVHRQDSGLAEGYDGDYSMCEVHESYHKLCDWIKLDGSPAGFGNVEMNPDEMLQVIYFSRLCKMCGVLADRLHQLRCYMRLAPCMKPSRGASVHCGPVFLALL